jgi:hypothetical protein
MATDGDRHQLGDPITRMTDASTSPGPSIGDTRPAAELSEEELRREIANLETIVHEAPVRGTADDTVAETRERLNALQVEYQRRTGGSQSPLADHRQDNPS